MMGTSFQYAPEELRELGLAELGKNLLIDKTVRFYGAQNIRIGDNTRIDAYCVISAGSAGVSIGRYTHISTGVALLGGAGITIEDFCAVSAKVCIFTANDDYTGGAMTNPMVPDEYRHVTNAPVVLKRHVIVGAGSVIMPGVTIGLGGSVGALSFVNQSVADFAIVAGCPIRTIGQRGRDLLALEARFLASIEPVRQKTP